MTPNVSLSHPGNRVQFILLSIFVIFLFFPANLARAAFHDLHADFPLVIAGEAEWGDYDGDGDLDFLLIGSSLGVRIATIYDNDGSGGFTENLAAGLEGVIDAAADWGDYDGDGDLDLVIEGGADSGHILRVYENNGDGTFTAATVTGGPGGLWGGDVAWGDYDGDGDLDFIASGRTTTTPFTGIFRNDGAGTFTRDTGVGLLALSYYGSVDWGDCDNDGDLDFILTGTSGYALWGLLYTNDGSGVFSASTAGLDGVYYSDADFGDYDDDGDLDIVITGQGESSQINRIYKNQGDGTFTANWGFRPMERSSVDWGDFDNDGDLDIVYCGEQDGYDPVAEIYVNDGDGTFSDYWGDDFHGVQGGNVAWGDCDNDGDLDVIITGNGYFTAIYRNDGMVFNTAPTAPSGLDAVRSGETMSFSWGPGGDLETAAAALSYNLRVGTSRAGSEIVVPMADLDTGYRQVVGIGNRGGSADWQMEGLQRAWYWSVQTIDHGHMGSSFAPVDSILYMPMLTSVEDVPEDQGGRLRLRIRASDLDAATVPDYPIASYNIWRRLDEAPLAGKVLAEGRRVPTKTALPDAALEWEGRVFATGAAADAGASELPAGLWEVVGSFAAAQAPDYWTVVPTLADAGAMEQPWSVYVVSAHTTTPSIWFASDPDSNYSVDNIAPNMPAGVMVAYAFDGNALEWLESDAEDFCYFKIYRGDMPDFIVDPENPAHTTTARAWADGAGDFKAFYKVSVVDFAGNESPAAMPEELTEVGVVPLEFVLHQNAPNPFNPRTRIRFNLPEESRVSLRIYDVSGRLVQTLFEDSPHEPGSHEAVWNGRDASGRQAPASVYFYRIDAGEWSQTRRMMLVK